jgi:preprotein translocase subunit YajC
MRSNGFVNGLEQLLPFVLIAAVFWLLLIRPQRKRQQALMQTQRSLQLGDEVLLGAGIVGRVAELPDDEYLDLEVAPGVRMKALRGAVVRNLTDHRDEAYGGPAADDPTTTDRSASELPEDPSNGPGRDH